VAIVGVRWAGRSQIKFFPTIGEGIRVRVAATRRECIRRIGGNRMVRARINIRRSVSRVRRDSADTGVTKGHAVEDLFDAKSMEVSVGGMQVVTRTKRKITPVGQNAATVAHE